MIELIAILIILVLAWVLTHKKNIPQPPVISIKNGFYYHGDDCPFMSVNDFYAEQFLEWVWDNRKRIEVAGLPYYCRWDNNWVFFITTPYVLGGWMFITCKNNGIDLYVAKDLDAFGRSYSKATYCPNWSHVSTSSKRLWLKVYKYFEEQKAMATEKYGKKWVNPKLYNNAEHKKKQEDYKD